MEAAYWEQLRGTVLDDTFQLEHLVRAGSQRAVFTARNVAGDTSDNSGQIFSVQIFHGDETLELEQVARRFQEAAFLNHPNLLHISKVGRDASGEFVYVVSEKAEYTLPQFVEHRPLPIGDARELTSHLIAALTYLHSENLIFCNLGIGAVWKIGSEWKLADFSQLRVTGSADARELRRALARLPGAPPEAFEGVLSPAWDVWSLGALLQRVLTPEPTHVEGSISLPRGRHLREHGLPEPYDSITRDCLEPNPDLRITLQEIEARLNFQPVPDVLSTPADNLTHPEQSLPSEPVPQLQNQPGRSNRERARAFWERISKPASTLQALAAFAGGVVLVALIGLLLAFLENRKSTNPPSASATSISRQTAPEGDRSRPNPAEPLATFGGTRTPNSSDEAGIHALLNQWTNSARHRDLNAQVDCYAPVVSAFYNRHGVSQKQIYAEKQRQFGLIGPVHKYELSNVQIKQVSPSNAVVVFDKTWDFGDTRKFAGAEKAQLTLNKFGQNWKITGEKELKVYWVRRSLPRVVAGRSNARLPVADPGEAIRMWTGAGKQPPPPEPRP
jgi:serine/threonine protein kinase